MPGTDIAYGAADEDGVALRTWPMEGAPTPERETNCEKAHSWYRLYGVRGRSDLISPCTCTCYTVCGTALADHATLRNQSQERTAWVQTGPGMRLNVFDLGALQPSMMERTVLRERSEPLIVLWTQYDMSSTDTARATARRPTIQRERLGQLRYLPTRVLRDARY
eukprot:3485640-Rhodomonas_salina.3